MEPSTYEPLERVGRDVDAVEYWRGRAGRYNDHIDGPYHAHRLRVIDRLLDGLVGPGKRIIDFGCGEGVLLERVAGPETHLIGLDPVDEMVEAARARLDAAGLVADVRLGGVEGLATVDDASTDLLMAFNVLAYFEDDEADRFYREAARIVRPGGTMVVTHSNELFDLASLNRYTVDFHARYLSGAANAERVASLLTRPSEPERVTFNVRGNPLSYRHLLDRYAFDEQQQEFINLHPLPPLLMDPAVFDDPDARDYEDTLDWSPDDRWKLLFQCSMFGSRSIRR